LGKAARIFGRTHAATGAQGRGHIGIFGGRPQPGVAILRSCPAA